MLRAAGGAATTEAAHRLHQHFIKLTTSQRLAAPRPQKQEREYAHILGWEEREKEEAVVAPPASGRRRLQCLHQVYIESVLAQHHARLRRREFNLAWTKASRRTAASEVHPWPPVPTRVASPHETESHLRCDAIAVREDETRPQEHPAPQWAASSGYADMPSIGDIEEFAERPHGSPASFIDSEGLEWPLPPRECLVSPIADVVPAHRITPAASANSPSASTTTSMDNSKRPAVSPASFVETEGFEWPLPLRERLTFPDPDMPSSTRANSDRTSDRTPPLVCDTSRTSMSSSSTPPTLPLTPIGADDDCYEPSAAPAGVGVIGEGRPSPKTTTEVGVCGKSGTPGPPGTGEGARERRGCGVSEVDWWLLWRSCRLDDAGGHAVTANKSL
ncbi:hypothetical protein K466DRAFT_586362 [Polyporus arcularius HHB13444]|uniref:Uncharacterized protein n=1 Tax=Polyporus arcularius HHB13444 TaxID=1314778 RepID=A0A5C3PCK1_9APHY|nr:hypothetical protein K466DRAFT_586362 [Polyporus arcularius HHB13444]